MPPCSPILTLWLSRMAAVGEVFFCRPAHPLAQPIVDVLPVALALPLAEVVVDRGPGRKIMRQQSPGATGLGDIEDGIDDATAFMLEGTPHDAVIGNQRLDHFPLGVGQVGRIIVFYR